jgi:putative phosphoesterase
VAVAVLSDVHGNLPALRAVLAELERTPGVERIVGCGDLASGPLPAATVDVLRELDGFVSVRGNADRGAVEAFDGEAAANTHEDDLWTGEQLSRPQRDWLASQPASMVIEVEGLGPVRFCHGTPRRDDEIVLETTPEPEVAAMLAGVDETVVVCGNTHMTFDRRVGRHRLVNAGSVGWAYGHTDAEWLLLGPDVRVMRTSYDIESAIAELRAASTWPRLETFIQQPLVEPIPRERALRAFEQLAASSKVEG